MIDLEFFPMHAKLGKLEEKRNAACSFLHFYIGKNLLKYASIDLVEKDLDLYFGIDRDELKEEALRYQQIMGKK